MDTLPQRIQALLFAEGGSMTHAALAKTLHVSTDDIRSALTTLQGQLQFSGLSVVVSDTEASLVVADIARDIIAAKAKEESERDIGDAGLEVLAILLYEGSSTRADIDYIRGVNSSTSIRNLLSRGLIERAGNPNDAREYVYRPTTELLAHLGVTRKEELPEYGIISSELATFKASCPETHESPGTTDSARNDAF